MKITIQTKELLRAVNACAKVINSKNALAILDNVLLSQKDECFTLTGSNSDQRYETVLESLVVTDGEFSPICLPHKILQASLATLTDDLLQIEVKGTQIKVKYEGGEFNLVAFDANEYPVAPELSDGASEFTIQTDKFLSAVKRANVLTANDELRPIMAGVAVDMRADALVIVGSDGHRLFKYEMPEIGAGYLKGNPMTAVIPKALVPALDNLRAAETITFKADGLQLMISNANAVITSRVIDGKYPNYNSVIPADAPTKMTVNVKNFMQVVRRIAVFAPSTSLVVLGEKDGQMYVSTENIDFSTSSSEQLAVVEQNLTAGIRIGLNYQNLLSCLGNIDTENVTLCIRDGSNPVKYKADEKENDPTVMIQMPMIIS